MSAHLNFKEREEFSQRLRMSLQKAGINPNSPTQFHRALQLADETLRISLSTIYRWLLGDSLPSEENMKIVANLCNVCPQWLRSGRTTVEI